MMRESWPLNMASDQQPTLAARAARPCATSRQAVVLCPVSSQLQVSDEGLAHLHALSELQVLNLAGLHVRCGICGCM